MAAVMMPCVMFAVRRESMYFRRVRRTFRCIDAAPCSAELCGDSAYPILLVESGIGESSVNAAFDWLLDGELPAFVIYAGFAGALDASLRVGDVIWAETVLGSDGRSWPATLYQPRLRTGHLFTSTQFVARAEEKALLHVTHKVDAVEMEGATAAARCAAKRIPFGCVRAISDSASTSLSPSLVSLLVGGRVSPLRVVAALLRRPMLLPEILRLERDTRRAARELSAALVSILPALDRGV